MNKKLQLLEAEIIRIATAHPDAVYVSGSGLDGIKCRYNEGQVLMEGGAILEGEGCLIGRAFRNLGFTADDGMSLRGNIMGFLEQEELSHEEDKLKMDILKCQRAQDQGSPWFRAISYLNRR